MAQAGHVDPKMTLGIYAQVIASKVDLAKPEARWGTIENLSQRPAAGLVTGAEPDPAPDKGVIKRNRA
jgi:hypothetical protein